MSLITWRSNSHTCLNMHLPAMTTPMVPLHSLEPSKYCKDSCKTTVRFYRNIKIWTRSSSVAAELCTSIRDCYLLSKKHHNSLCYAVYWRNLLSFWVLGAKNKRYNHLRLLEIRNRSWDFLLWPKLTLNLKTAKVKMYLLKQSHMKISADTAHLLCCWIHFITTHINGFHRHTYCNYLNTICQI